MSCLVRVEVDDNAVSRMATRGGGRGMLLIAGFARRWGIGSAPGSGKRVWADVECGVLPGVGCAAAS
ncbi:hypothetical protein ACWEKJ_20775 [Amycolatopsis thermoflava]|uniref:hypothetical protein n=1 Tax=Amycolatopsis thermoflava TaxID=84480 RepID=UPI003EBDF321